MRRVPLTRVDTVTTTVFETTDFDAAQEFLSGVYGPLRLSVPAGPHHVRLTRHVLGAAQLHRIAARAVVHVDGAPLGLLGFGRIVGGSVTCRTGGRERTYDTAGEIFFAAQPDQPYRATLADADLEFAFLDPELVAQVADPAPSRAARPVRFTGGRPVSTEAASWWSNTYNYVRDHLAGGPIAGQPLVRGNAARLLAATALTAFPHDGLDEPTAADHHDAHPATLRRAVAFIEDNAHRDIGPADIAAAARVTIRSLQLTFRRHLDTTPLAYLRRVRLAHAHRELLAADPATTTVGAVAARWGFDNHSRFTAHYRAAYGLAPSATLRHRSDANGPGAPCAPGPDRTAAIGGTGTS
jgi:AraC-like DNA-binding protein